MIQMNGSVQDLKGKIANHEQTLNTKEREMKSIDESWSANFEEHLTITYREKYTNHAMLNEAALNVVVMATVDRITLQLLSVLQCKFCHHCISSIHRRTYTQR
jgi:hypothetical protein